MFWELVLGATVDDAGINWDADVDGLMVMDSKGALVWCIWVVVGLDEAIDAVLVSTSFELSVVIESSDDAVTVVVGDVVTVEVEWSSEIDVSVRSASLFVW